MRVLAETVRTLFAGLKKQKTTLFVSMLCAALLLAGCGKKEPQTATLVLPSNPTTGYTWEVTQTDPIFEVKSEFAEDAHDEEMAGVGGTETFVLTPQEKGETEVTFAYGQHWEGGNTDTVVTYGLEVDRNLQIRMVSMTGSLPRDAGSLPSLPELVIKTRPS